MVQKKFLISTNLGMPPHIININKIIKNPKFIVYLDSLLYKDSPFLENMNITLNNFINTKNDIFIDFKYKDLNLPKISKKKVILKSKKGIFVLEKKIYNDFINNYKINYFVDYDTKKLLYNNLEVIDPRDLNHFNELFNDNVVLTTNFLNDINNKGFLIKIKNNKLEKYHINDSDNDYLKYIYKINEISAFTIISEINYKTLNNFYKINK